MKFAVCDTIEDPVDCAPGEDENIALCWLDSVLGILAILVAVFNALGSWSST